MLKCEKSHLLLQLSIVTMHLEMIANKTHTKLMGIVIKLIHAKEVNGIANNKTGQVKIVRNKSNNTQHNERLGDVREATQHEPNMAFKERGTEKMATAGRGFVSNFGDAHILSFLIGGLS